MKKNISSIITVLAMSVNAFAFYQETDIAVYSNEDKGNEQNVHDLLAQLESGWFVMTDIRPVSNRCYYVTSPVNYESGVNFFSLYWAGKQSEDYLPQIEWDKPTLHMFKADKKIKKPDDKFTRVHDISTEDFSIIINAWENLLSPTNHSTLLNSKFTSERAKQSLEKALKKDYTNFEVESIQPQRNRIFRRPVYQMEVCYFMAPGQGPGGLSISFVIKKNGIKILRIGEILY
ncbi:hypothetical protein P4C99_17100 [Pontiellaceae bacterium B1224]|nr:hypothetical protein [Pontiellaceae bacterium B1224]